MIVSPVAAEFQPSMLDRAGNESARIAGAWWLMFGLAAVVYVVVAGLLFAALLRRRATGLNESAFVLVGGVLAPVAVLGVLGFVTVTTTRDLRNPVSSELRIRVVAHDWWWDVTYTDAGIRTANEIHVPVGRAIDLQVRSADVIHSVWMPQIAGKVDAIPGQTNHLRFVVHEPGEYLGECAEYCSVGHAHMRFVLYAEPSDEFGRWQARQSNLRPTPNSEAEAEGERVFMRQACAGCHTITGTSAVGKRGPDLTGFGAREWIAAVTLRNTKPNLAAWLRDPEHVKPGSLMPNLDLSDDEIRALVAYLKGQR